MQADVPGTLDVTQTAALVPGGGKSAGAAAVGGKDKATGTVSKAFSGSGKSGVGRGEFHRGNSGFKKGEFSRGGAYGGSVKRSDNPDVIYGRDFEEEAMRIEDIIGEIGEVVIRGKILNVDKREIKNEKSCWSSWWNGSKSF